MNDIKEHRIETVQAGGANVYLIINGSQSILIDAGDKRAASKILEKLNESGLEPQDVKLIILTHTHPDHCGSLKELQDVTQANILVHESEAESLTQGYGGFPKGTMLLGKVISFIGRNLARGLSRFEAVTPDITISERFDLTPYEIDGYITPTPGHSSGSLCIIVDGKTALVGDTMFGISKRSVFPPFADDVDELLKSWKLLIDTGCQHFLPGHGRSISIDELRTNYEQAQSRRS